MKLEVINNILYLDSKPFQKLKENDVDDFCKNMISLEHDDFLKVKKLCAKAILKDLLFEGSYNDIFYQFFRDENSISLRITKCIEVQDWSERISPKDYCIEFMARSSTFNVLYDDGVIFIEILYRMDKDDLLEEYFQIFSDDFIKINNKIITKNRIKNTITFSYEHLSAGISILQYFGKLLQEKYPDRKVSVSIKQEDLKVTMFIETPDGKKEEVEEYLNRYGMVVTNQITPEEFTSNQIQVLELETKLEAAKMEIGFQKKLLALQDKTYDENLVSIKDEVEFLRAELSSIRTSNNQQLNSLLSSILSKDKLVQKLAKLIDKRDKEKTKQLLVELKENDSKEYKSLKEHVDSIIVGNLTNTPAWLEFIKQLF